jgi:maltooligosyltrehalose trehalohydrolase
MPGPTTQTSNVSGATSHARRRFPIGVECIGDGRSSVRVWAPASRRVEFVIEDGAAVGLEPEGDGYFSGTVEAAAGSLYRFRLEDGKTYPDPASRFQPLGPHGPSEIVDPATYPWTDAQWPGVKLRGQVIYELHVGTFTPAGDWASAERELAELAACGITLIEVMPVAEFDGRFGWGYDGVDLFAPMHTYGRPDDFRRFVDRAHALGIGIILDVVYTHFGRRATT